MRDERFRDFRRLCISLWAKRLMKKWILWLLMALAAVSCGLEEVGRRPNSGEGVWVRPGVNVDSVALDGDVVYVTAMEYFDRYNWLSDPGRGEVKCSLAVYADGIPMMKIPVGDRYEVSSDPESHRIVNGHLFTDYVSENETVIKKDGKALIRYSGREMICGLVERGDGVYTLGHNLEGDGFSYRKNGEVLLERAGGDSFGSLYEYGDSLFFAFREPVASEEELLERYYCSVDGVVSQVAVREDVKRVWDVALYKGEVCYVALLVGIPAPVLVTYEGMQALTMPPSSEMLDCRIITAGDSLYVEGSFQRDGMEITGGLWYSDGRSFPFALGMTAASSCTYENAACFVLNPSPPYNKGVIYMSSTANPMPDGFAVMGSRTCSVSSGLLHVGLSSLSGSSPAIWRDGHLIPLEINGFITSVSVN